jgi:hypothetical protein
VKRAFRVFGTGNELPEGAKWVATCPRTPDGIVLHLYELPAVEPRVPGVGGYRPGIEGD